MKKFVELINQQAGAAASGFLSPVAAGLYSVRFCVVTRKNLSKKTANLPLFSRMSLMRCMQSLQLMGVDRSIVYIADQSPSNTKTKKAKKPKPVTP